MRGRNKFALLNLTLNLQARMTIEQNVVVSFLLKSDQERAAQELLISLK